MSHLDKRRDTEESSVSWWGWSLEEQVLCKPVGTKHSEVIALG